MTAVDLGLFAAIIAAVTLALRSMHKRRKKGTCCGDCSSCSGCK